MVRLTLRALVVCSFGIILTACGEDAQEPAVSPQFAQQPDVCDFRDAKALARDFFLDNAQRRRVQGILRDMEGACQTFGPQGTQDDAFGFEVITEVALGAQLGQAGSSQIGSDLVNELLGLMQHPYYSEPLDFSVALSDPNGLFDVRPLSSSVFDDEYVTSRGSPVWGVEPQPGLTWTETLAYVPSILYGYPLEDGLPHRAFDGYELSIFPDLLFAEQPVVGTCQEPPFLNPALEGERIRRNTTALEPPPGLTQPGYCGGILGFGFHPEPQGALESLARRLLELTGLEPQPLVASVLSPGPPMGLASGFTPFWAAVERLDAHLEFMNQPCDATVGADIVSCEDGPIQVLAKTNDDPPGTPYPPGQGDGSPLERICIELSAVNNNGQPGLLQGDTISVTIENGGYATFDPIRVATAADGDPSASGGYRLLAEAIAGVTVLDEQGREVECSLLGFTFESATSGKFNVRPH